MGVRLPAEYQEVEWIQKDRNSSGEAYILTDYVPVNGDSIDATVMVTNSETQCIFSAGAGTYQFIALFDNPSAGQTIWCKYFQKGGAPKMMPTNFMNTWQHLTVSGTGLFQFAGESVQCDYQAPLDGDYTELMFFSRRHVTSDVNFLGKLKEVVVANNDQNKLHLIPCYRKSDSEPGMYDLVTKQFFTNAGTGEFEVGPDVIDSISPWLVAWRRAMMQNVKSARLPREYQEVEYIEGTGTQYININSTDQRYEMECECLFPSSRTNGAMLWGGSSFSDSDAWALFQSSPALTLRRRNNGNSDCSLSNNVYINKKIHVELFESHCRFSDEDGEVLAEKVATKQKQYTTYMWLFHGYSNGGYSTRYVSARLYWMKVYINGTLVYHLIPCYRKGDGEIGVYDLINNRFNANNGTGVFLKGKNV